MMTTPPRFYAYRDRPEPSVACQLGALAMLGLAVAAWLAGSQLGWGWYLLAPIALVASRLLRSGPDIGLRVDQAGLRRYRYTGPPADYPWSTVQCLAPVDADRAVIVTDLGEIVIGRHLADWQELAGLVAAVLAARQTTE